MVGAQVTVPPSNPPTLGTKPLYEFTVEHVIEVKASACFINPPTAYIESLDHLFLSLKRFFPFLSCIEKLICAPDLQSPMVGFGIKVINILFFLAISFKRILRNTNLSAISKRFV